MNTLYHGTTTRLGNLKKIKPASETKYLREIYRQKEQNLVFLTDSLRAAKRYAQLACETFAGQPVVYIVENNDTIVETRPHEYTGTYADVIDTVTQ